MPLRCSLLPVIMAVGMAFQHPSHSFHVGSWRFNSRGMDVWGSTRPPLRNFPRNALYASSSTPSITGAQDRDRQEKKKPSFPMVLWRFTRPHTIIGSALAIPALHLLAAPTYAAAFTTRSLASMVYAMIPALLMNLYITGLNQVTDVEIDKINKPNLPIAAGDLSKRDGIITILVALALSLILGFAHPVYGTQGLNVALWVSGILGTLYSLEPFRLKRFPFLAAFCIVAVRGAVINAGFFAHAKAAGAIAGATATATSATSVLGCLMNDPRCWLSSLYFAVFGIVIALMKDVPDVKGDALSNVRTFSVRWGPQSVFAGMHRLLAGLFLGVGVSFAKGAVNGWSSATALASSSSSLALSSLPWGALMIPLGRAIVGLSAVMASWSVHTEARKVDPTNPSQVYKYYMHLWKLFYLSYLVLPLAR
jgi:homogentisate phytyltransferase/homogentisate geranylgeranyltransferase